MLKLFGPFLAGWYVFKQRPENNRWGASEEEMNSELPGDGLVTDNVNENTRAITIRKSPKEIWPWIIQIGKGRAGFYSYDFIEKLFGIDISSVETVMEEYQNLKEGDWIAISDDGPGFEVYALRENEYLVLKSKQADHLDITGQIEEKFWEWKTTWSFVLRPVDDDLTRLIVRTRYNTGTKFLGKIFNYLIFEPGHFLMERKMMWGIKERAEKRR